MVGWCTPPEETTFPSARREGFCVPLGITGTMDSAIAAYCHCKTWSLFNSVTDDPEPNSFYSSLLSGFRTPPPPSGFGLFLSL